MRLGIFKDHVFEGVSEEQLYKSQMNGLNDPTLRHFQLLSTSSLMKAEFKQNQYELEYIQSYLNAAKELADIGNKGRQDRMLIISTNTHTLYQFCISCVIA